MNQNFDKISADLVVYGKIFGGSHWQRTCDAQLR